MCGIFGWIGQLNRPPDLTLLAAAVQGAAARGPHGHGWVTGASEVHRALGPLDPAAVTVVGQRLLGHARLATYGALSDLAAVQPISVDGHHLVHNGNAVRAYHTFPDAASDSAALGMVYARLRREGLSPWSALSKTTEIITGPWAIALLDADDSLVVSRRGLPLNMTHTRTGLYLSSGELPAVGLGMIPEGEPWVLFAREEKVSCG